MTNFEDLNDQLELEHTITTITHDLEMEDITHERGQRYGAENLAVWQCKAKHVRKLATNRLNYLLKQEKMQLERDKTARHIATMEIKKSQVTEERNLYQDFFDEVDRISNKLNSVELNFALDALAADLKDVEERTNRALEI